MSRDHEAHQFSRLISESDTGQAVYGCTFARCPETEIRRKGEPSPFAQKRQAAKARKAVRA